MANKLKCPKCTGDVGLERISLELIDVDQCPRCEGVWFDHFAPELQTILENGRDHVPAELKDALRVETGKITPTEAKGAGHLCPRCGIKLRTYWYASEVNKSFQIDGCPAGDGVWFDDGELGKAFDFLKNANQALTDYYRQNGILGKVNDLRKSRAKP
jgi:Zn-finger nucleic acid-binding protein